MQVWQCIRTHLTHHKIKINSSFVLLILFSNLTEDVWPFLFWRCLQMELMQHVCNNRCKLQEKGKVKTA